MSKSKKLPKKTIAAIERMLDAGDGDRRIAAAIGGITRHDVRKVILARAEQQGEYNAALAVVPAGGALSFYDTARRALAQAKNLGDVKDVADRATALKEYARRASDRILEIDAAELRIRAERRLGEMLAATPLSVGGRPRKDKAPLLSELATPSCRRAPRSLPRCRLMLSRRALPHGARVRRAARNVSVSTCCGALPSTGRAPSWARGKSLTIALIFSRRHRGRRVH
jgi:hypothetical protein